jgi:catechol 2,3-dioxygenase-like lactoylglutathione lyase family enzyme
LEFAFTQGEPQRFRSSARVERSFCGRCGTPLTYVRDERPEVDVTTASLDAPERAAPMDHTWVADRLPWWRPEPRWPEFREARIDAPPELEVIGLDHVYLAVTEPARSLAFYDPVLAALGFKKTGSTIAGDPHAHYWNRSLQISIRPARAAGVRHDPYAPGLHHLCLQLRDDAALDAAHAKLRALGVEATEPRLYPQYSDDYYATFFDDPDGIRLELVARRARRNEVVARWDVL